jgi:hypothetical protein
MRASLTMQTLFFSDYTHRVLAFLILHWLENQGWVNERCCQEKWRKMIHPGCNRAFIASRSISLRANLRGGRRFDQTGWLSSVCAARNVAKPASARGLLNSLRHLRDALPQQRIDAHPSHDTSPSLRASRVYQGSTHKSTWPNRIDACTRALRGRKPFGAAPSASRALASQPAVAEPVAHAPDVEDVGGLGRAVELAPQPTHENRAFSFVLGDERFSHRCGRPLGATMRPPYPLVVQVLGDLLE